MNISDSEVVVLVELLNREMRRVGWFGDGHAGLLDLRNRLSGLRKKMRGGV